MVTYGGNAAAIPDLTIGQIDLMFVEQSIVMGRLAAGSIKAYAILAKNRSAAVAFAAHHKAEIEKWTPMIKAANIKTD
jgi:tripartite-type tricarboxylate transporter receptor subunit TctC